MKIHPQKKDLLLAEDDSDDVEIFEMALDDIGVPYILRHVKNSDELFNELEKRLPEILFVDMHLPCKDGMSCISEIRGKREYDNVPIVMYTAHASNRIAKDCFDRGANLYVSKDNSTLSGLTSKLKTVFAKAEYGKLLNTSWEEFVVN